MAILTIRFATNDASLEVPQILYEFHGLDDMPYIMLLASLNGMLP